MELMMLSDIARWTGGVLAGTDLAITTVSTDSRKASAGALFVPLVGESFDGHDFIENAVQNGATAIVSARAQGKSDVPCVRVADTGKALRDIARGYRDQMGCTVIGVTGSVGKTTTKDMLYETLAAGLPAQKTQGNFNNEIGVPLTLLTLEKDTRVLACEMGMNHAGELSRISQCAAPDIAIITNIGVSHIAFFGSKEGILNAKLEILDGMPDTGVAILCADDALLYEASKRLPVRTITYGIDNKHADLTAEMLEGGAFLIRNNALVCHALPIGGTFEARLQVEGAHNVRNALACAAAGLVLGETTQEIATGLMSFVPTGLRQNRYDENGFHIFADCYNASPDAVQATLQVLHGMEGKRFAVLGSMLELGDYAPRAHEDVGRAAAKYADVLYAYGPNALDMVRGAKAAGMQEAKAFGTHEGIIQALRLAAQKGDSLLFKGSRGMKMEEALAGFLKGEEV